MSDIFSKIKNDPKYNQHNSTAWFTSKVQQLYGGRITGTKMMQESKANLTSQIMPGGLYAFAYDPKHKETLPFYDKFPLVLPFHKEAGSFHGLNLHYLHPRFRILLLDKMMQFAKHNKKGEVEYLRFSWSLIGSAAKFKEVKPCVKMYLMSHVRTKFIKIPPEDWLIASQLPMGQFAKARAREVWKKSTNTINGI